MEVRFREVDPFNCWIWLHFSEPPSQGEKNYIDGIFDSWYVIGRLGGFNGENLQSHNESSDLSWKNYDNELASSSLPSLMHNMSNLEYQSDWGRCWVDLGTCDPIGLDILINSLRQIDIDLVEIKEIIIGGVNGDWDVEEHPDAIFNSPS